MTRRGFTLIEILVSLMIFSIVSLAMLGILLASTNIFRFGEFGRASTDEAVSTLAILDEDVRHMVPGRDGGLFYSILHDPITSAQVTPQIGDCATAFMIYQENPGQIQGQSANLNPQATKGGFGARQLVIYYVEHLSAANNLPGAEVLPDEEVLWRIQAPILADIPLQDYPPPNQFPQPYAQPLNDTQFIEQLLDPGDRAVWLAWELVPAHLNPPMAAPSAVARRVLHFGTWISNDVQQRTATGNWLVDASSASIPPCYNAGQLTAYATEADPNGTSPMGAAAAAASPFPNAVLFTLCLAVGRYAPQGTVASDQAGPPEQIRIANIPALPGAPGSLVRVGNEWIAYSSYAGGLLTVLQPNQDPLLPGGGRGALRSRAQPSINNGMSVQWGPMYSLARTFPH